MRRRELIILLGSSIAVRPLFAHAQQEAQIAGLGYRDGQNLSIDFRFVGDDIRGLSKAAAELVQKNVDVVVADGPEAALQAALRASSSVPVVILAVNYD